MKICVLQSSYEGSNSPLEDPDGYADPSLFTAQHEFHHRFILKATAVSQIDDAVTEGFDLFFNFMWGQLEDSVAGIEAVRYLESLGVEFVGLTSSTLSRSKLDFYSSAREAGLSVPASGEDAKFPLFVKPSKMCASMFIDEKSVCNNQEELDRQLVRINEHLAPGRREAARPTIQRSKDADGGGGSVVVSGNEHGDVVVQEFIPGVDYGVVVIEMGNTPVAQNPTKFRYAKEKAGVGFMTFDVKFHPETREELLDRSENPALFDTLRALATQAWHVNKMQGNSWGRVDIRVRDSDGRPFVLEANPQPALFYRWEHGDQDFVIHETFPGGHRALLNVLITTKLLQSEKHKVKVAAVAGQFDKMSERYDSNTKNLGLHKFLVADFDFSGTVLDLGSGTGEFGRVLHEQQRKRGGDASKQPLSTVVGNDISVGMLQQNQLRNQKVYDKVIFGPLQEVIMNTSESIDHIVSLGVLCFLDEVTLSAVLTRMFQVARRSVTFTVDEIPEAYNESVKNLGLPFMKAHNHLAVVEGYGVPRGWKLARRHRTYGWSSPKTGVEVHLTVFRFEALKPLQATAPNSH